MDGYIEIAVYTDAELGISRAIAGSSPLLVSSEAPWLAKSWSPSKTARYPAYPGFDGWSILTRCVLHDADLNVRKTFKLYARILKS